MPSPTCLTMTNKELFYLTGKCMMLDEVPAFKNEITQKIQEGSVDWRKFVALCSNHLILPAIYLKFRSHGIIELLPADLSEYLKYIYELNLSRNNQILEQLEDLTIILNKSEIYPVFLKGSAHLLDELYSDHGERIMGDIDFLVPEKEYLKTVGLLEKEGYVNISPYPAYFEVESLKHYPPVFKEGFPAYLEIHQALTEHRLSWFNPRIATTDKKTVKPFKGCYVLSDHYKIIHNFVHTQLHHGGHINGLVSIRDLYDLFLLSKRSDLKQTLPHIRCRRKAIAYFAFAGRAFGLGDRFFAGNNFSGRLFSKKHDLNLSSPAFYKIHQSAIFILQRIFIGYASQILQSLYSKKVRRSVMNRLSDRKWYIAHFQTYRTFFGHRPNRPNEK